MESYKIRYIKNCVICDKLFYPNQNHAKTSSLRYRSILHKLKIGLKLFCMQIGYELVQLSELETKDKASLINTAKMCDSLGNRILKEFNN